MKPRGTELATGAVLGALCAFFARDLDLAQLVSYAGVRSPGVVLGAAVGAVVWASPLRRGLAWLTSLLALAFLLVAFTPLTSWMYEGLLRRDSPVTGDAVFVSSSRLQSDGELTTSAMNRLVHGLEVIADGGPQRLILTELRPPQRSYVAAARPILEHLGLHPQLLAVGPVDNTRDEAVLVAALCRKMGLRRLILVTSPTHCRRAAATLEREGLVVAASPSMETRYDLDRLDRADERLGAFGDVLHERVGLWVYARRGWIEPRALSSR